ncbi:uncharacterized protein MYCGRDRAFT_75424 [Zymoseptoria tritici IPO323]|uniref:Spindle pole body component n=1 Tax=Zymoseptoria tritici (strain CBS 115943 / IPO323) TaxID=336722 RepID=F9XJI5_ZYMTI|nr:uncharacterized protein MYCGRDRAFT_75424 [Zymoseptoria tritici IPO323]EGP84329.1 hypothetical protein MYCGRDRAFT_75424 [Zymoseptoria tritici IPO323]
MLHEVLLALSGHPSPLFSSNDASHGSEDFPLLSPSEKALLASIGRLSELHRKLKRHLEAIAAKHSSIVCRAVATSVKQSHLSRFQQKIVDVESKILKRDASMVGAYHIVPLASVVGEFDDWHRRMNWYWDVASFMSPSLDSGRKGKDMTTSSCTSAAIIDKLRAECQTGYPEIEEAATELTRVAETAWLRQLSGWIVYGKLPIHGAQDFFVRVEESSEGKTFTKNNDLLPSFVAPRTASSLMFIGKSLHQVEHHRKTNSAASVKTDHLSNVASAHLKILSQISLPITASQFSRTVSEVRLSLSRSVLQHLLPMNVTLQVLKCLRQFFLLDHGDFAMALITEAEDRLQARQQSMGRLLQQDPTRAMQSLTIKDAELSQALTRVWKSLAIEGDDMDDDLLDYAQRHVTLSSAKQITSRPSTADSSSPAVPSLSPITFNDLLFPTPSELSLKVIPPLDLFLSARDVGTYSSISSYILAIRRGHHRLSDLWRRTPARRDHPISSAQDPEARIRNKQRAIKMRKVWATCSAAIFLLSETAAYFEGEIIRGSCDHFQQWVEKPTDTAASPSTANDNSTNAAHLNMNAQRDPETLATAHRSFLAGLTYSLLLTDIAYTSALRTLLSHIDALVAFFTHLLSLQQNLDAQIEATGHESAYTLEEEKTAALELDRARKRVDSGMRDVVGRLRGLDQERIGSGRYLDLGVPSADGYEGWKGGGVDRLLMKLEFGTVVNSEEEKLLDV